MAPTIIPRTPSADNVRHLGRSLSSKLSKLTVRDITLAGQPLASIFALILTSRSSLSRRALTSIAELSSSSQYHPTLAVRSPADHISTQNLNKRQTVILAIPTIYQGLNDGPAPGAVVGITLGSVFGFLLILWIISLSAQVVGGYGQRTVVQEEVVVKRRGHKSRSKHSSSHHVSPAPPPPRRETVIEIQEEIIRHSPPPPRRHSPDLSLDEVIVHEEESSLSVSEEIVVVEEDPSSLSSVSSRPPPRQSSAGPRRSGGFRTVDPREPGGGNAPMRRMSRRSSGRG